MPASASIAKTLSTLGADHVRTRLDYDPATGVFRWKRWNGAGRGWNEKMAGTVAGCLSHGYKIIRFEGRIYKSSHLAWLIQTGEWPSGQIDHANGNPLDEHWGNLRDSTPSQNSCNRGIQKNNSSGFKGVYWQKALGKWRAKIHLHGKSFHLGLFPSREEAAQAYDAAASRFHGEFALTNSDLGRL